MSSRGRFFFNKNSSAALPRSNNELDSSAEIFGETPESSPAVTNGIRQVGSRRIPSDPADSGISDSGTKSKSSSPLDSDRHRSPQVIYASDDDDEVSGRLGASRVEESEEDVSEDVAEDSGDESILLPRTKKSAARIISDDESAEEGESYEEDRRAKSDESSEEEVEEESYAEHESVQRDEERDVSKRIDNMNFISEDESDDDQPLFQPRKETGKPVARNRLISEDFSSEDETDLGGRGGNELYSSGLENSSTRSNKKRNTMDDSEICLTPPPATPSPRPSSTDSDFSQPIKRPVNSVVRSPVKYQDTSVRQKEKQTVGDNMNDNVINVSSSEEEEEVQIVTVTKAEYTPEDIVELERQTRKLKSSIMTNQHMLQVSGRGFPDGGASLRSTVKLDSAKLDKLRATLGKARDQLKRITSGMLPQPPGMLKSLSGSSLPPINNLPPEEQLDRTKKKRSDLKKALQYSSRLSDGGDKMRDKLRETEDEIARLEKQVEKSQGLTSADPQAYTNQAWHTLKQNFMQEQSQEEMARMLAMGPGAQLYGGRMTTGRQKEVKTVTQDAMQKLLESLDSMPAEGDMEDQPRALKSGITLFPHQKQGLSWLLWRERQIDPGGVLADDMGLGKTLTMISLILKHNEILEERGEERDKESEWMVKGVGKFIRTKATMIICPASLMGQWENEIKSKVKSGVLRVLVYHGATARKVSAREMAKYDVIITTYGVILSEVKAELGDAFKEPKKLEAMVAAEEIQGKLGKLLSLAFQRIILDEAHTIRNPKSLGSQAVCKLRAARRWCVTGTPVQNKELDMYSLIRFLRVAPFDEYLVWKRWVENKSAQSLERMNTLVKSIMLRRTKDQKSNLTGKVLVDLPDKNIQTHEITLSEEENEVYLEVEKFARGAMERFMDQQGDDQERREMGLGGGAGRGAEGGATKQDDFTFKPYAGKKGDNEDVKVHHLLTLLLRMRQICCHPGLIRGMLDPETRQTEGIAEDVEEMDLISQLEDLNITKEAGADPVNILAMTNPIFAETRASSKIQTVVEELRRLKKKAEDTGVIEKAVVISQWTMMLDIVKVHLKEESIKFTEITGKVAISSRSGIVESFNKNQFGPQIMLLSLSAGGVGLNLVGANHLFLLDLHWNPQLESQACDRIYRVGQKKDVQIHKFLVKNTVEERIYKLQQAKLKMAEDVLSGAKKRSANKLTMNDLMDLFQVK